ncbi:4-hydroxy-2-oxovalerate aldolase [Fusibacter paucivorans]|uniref:4-hydroxy-2-oxovalerate aldolase n=1 Tax=Fusibacter paucivorans TaxID=76009 RepID=A0ABS5PT95_9FIRM|nr:4-hydroxy-2-oxovalerate aldolase [Fusibacter paucivorans]MBS7527599.1 4-hydroxy-2-oxovalerate aldolase [Fusibacter paucivorans]
MSITILDCTLRDGANVVGKGFSAELTDMMLDCLTACKVPYIEFGNAGGIGAYEVAGFTNAETDEVYLEIASKYLNRGSALGMFLNAGRLQRKSVELAKNAGLDFIRVGADAGDGSKSVEAVKVIKELGLKAFYSQMKAYLLSPEALAEEAKMLAEHGLDQITIMDSAGTMLPSEVKAYVKALKNAVTIPVGFHGHNNLGLSAANALAAYESGADVLDCGLMGMARSAGNLPTEVCIAIMQRYGELKDIELFKMLTFIDTQLQAKMVKHHYHNAISPIDLVLGETGCHSSFVKKFESVSDDQEINLYQLITAVSAVDRKNPSDTLIAETAKTL